MRVTAPDDRNKRIENILVLLRQFLWLQCPDEMTELRKGFDVRTKESHLAEMMCCLAASADKRITTLACDGEGDIATLV